MPIIMSIIKPLPDLVARQISSSVAVTTLNDVVFGLFRNSLDAGATKIHIDIDYNLAGCTMEDDGIGIPAGELSLAGNLAKPFHTSKHDQSANEPLHGFQGTFLSSLSTVSVLRITSKQRHDHKPGHLLFVHSEKLAPATNSETLKGTLRSRQHGTKISVQNLFGNMPVRVKQRPSGEAGRRQRDRLLRDLIHDLTGYILACRTDVQAVLKCEAHLHNWKMNRAYTPSFDQLRHRAEIGFDPSRLCHILNQVNSGFTSWSTWVQMSAHGPGIQIRGLMSKTPCANRACQFISLGIHPLRADSIHGALFETVNVLVASSTFGMEPPLHNEVSGHAMGNAEHVVNSTLDHTARNGPDRYPMFYIQIQHDVTPVKSIPRPNAIDQKEFGEIKSIIEVMIIGFLENQGFRRRKRLASPMANRSDTSRYNQLCPPSNFMTTSTCMKSGAPARKLPKLDLDGPQLNMVAGEKSTGVSTALGSPMLVSNEGPDSRLCQDSDPEIVESEDPLIRWQDPESGGTHWISPRTGMMRGRSTKNRASDLSVHPALSVQNGARRLTIPVEGKGESGLDDGADDWADEFLASWENPVYEGAEQPIPSATLDKDLLEGLTHAMQIKTGTTDCYEPEFRSLYNLPESRIGRKQLENATCIAQVDAKFILASVPGFESDSSSETDQRSLILVDQHAADERIRVEALLSALCEPSTSDMQIEGSQKGLHQSALAHVSCIELNPPITLNISAFDGKLLEEDTIFFGQWGIHYSVRLATRAGIPVLADSTSVQPEGYTSRELVVDSLPPLIAERCRLNPELLRDLLLNEARSRDESGLNGQPARSIDDSTEEANDKHWVRKIRDCPAGILDMINSRSCRSAIMFNDILDEDKCNDLLLDLSKTVYPFQCAHGRPSVVPIAGAEALLASRDLRLDHSQTIEFSKAWAAWNRSDDVGPTTSLTDDDG